MSNDKIYDDFCQAAVHGDINEINRIAKLVDKNRLHQMIYKPFQEAARNGHLETKSSPNLLNRTKQLT